MTDQEISGYKWKRMSEGQKELHLKKLVQEMICDGDDHDVIIDPLSADEDEHYVTDAHASDEETDLVLEGISDIEDSGDEEEVHTGNNVVAHPERALEIAQQHFVAEDGTKWQKQPPEKEQLSTALAVFQETGGHARRDMSQNPLDIFKAVITDEMVDIIMRETNRKAQLETTRCNNEKKPKKPHTWRPVTAQELYAYFGVLLAAGRHHANMEPPNELWKSDMEPVYRATMSLARFLAISRFIRFDDQRTRAERQVTDKAAAIRDLWIMFNHNLGAAYVPSEAIIVDEQLVPFRGKTKFTQYMPSKPDKYGIKVWWACDSLNGYPCKGFLYTGKETGPKPEHHGHREKALLDLTNKYIASGRTIIADNFLRPGESVDKLLAAGLAYVGALRPNKSDMPQEMLPHQSRPAHSTVFGFTNKVAMMSYVPKKNKAVILLSTVHYKTDVVGDAKKPHAIMFYDKHRGDTSKPTLEQMLAEFTCRRKTRRWPLVLFHNMLDVAALASFIIYTAVNEAHHTRSSAARRKFLDSLVEQLVTPEIEERMLNPRIIAKFSVKNGIEAFLGAPIQQSAPQSSNGDHASPHQRKSCRICEKDDKYHRKTRFACFVCEEPVCAQHSQPHWKCFKCVKQEEAHKK